MLNLIGASEDATVIAAANAAETPTFGTTTPPPLG